MSDESLNISFIQNHTPALESGQYRVSATQQVGTLQQNAATYTAEQLFYVAGKRYNIDAGEVNSVFPPLGSAGQYENVLPHIVLNTSSLPWQRATGFSGSLTAENKAPWMALLVFDESENMAAPQQVTLSTITGSSSSFFPPQTREPGDTDDTPVNVIDVPLTLFNRVCPTIYDLQWLAHVRKVSVANKSTSNDSAANDTYSVVIANRMPQENRITTVHLVSLENYSDYLPAPAASMTEYNTQSVNIPIGYSSIRLVSLYSWSFRCIPQLQSFGGLLQNADMNPPTLQLPFVTDTASSTTANQSVQNAFGMGYTAMNHQLRNGDRTVSWYRGPLLPLGTPPFLTPPYNSADSLMRYDPTLGMLDASYASAWQLGKLLALQDNAYAQTLVRWKSTQTQESAMALEEAIIDEQFSLPENGTEQLTAKKQSRLSFSIKNIVGPAAAKINSGSNTHSNG
jgi:hypothetical protein